MTTRVYLASARFRDEPVQLKDMIAERVFVNAGGVREIWVETESDGLPDIGRAVSFSLATPMDVGFNRITGTIERKRDKSTGR
jgi:predicted ester cyclase